MNTAEEMKFKLSHYRQLWHDFCEKHTELYELTCDEYMHLLASDIDSLEDTLSSKSEALKYINSLETHRNELTSEIAEIWAIEKPKKLADFLTVLKEKNEASIAEEIEKMNMILLDIIEKIQAQNKKNQVFLNKAIMSLNELKQSFNGKSNYKTYSPSGMTRSSTT